MNTRDWSRIFVTWSVWCFWRGIAHRRGFLRDAAEDCKLDMRKTPANHRQRHRQENQEGKPTGNFIFDVKYRILTAGNRFSSDQYKRNLNRPKSMALSAPDGTL